MPEGRYGYLSDVNITIAIDSTGERLDNDANILIVPAGHGSLSPEFDFLQVEGIELLTEDTLYNRFQLVIPEGGISGSNGIINSKIQHGSSITFSNLKLKLSFQKFHIGCKVNGNVTSADFLAFFGQYDSPGDSIYINDSLVNTQMIHQGDWYLDFNSQGSDTLLHGVTATITEPNFLHASMPTQSDSFYTIICPIDPPITFTKTQSHSFTILVSSNHAFEWIEHSDPAFFEPLDGDTIYDFGLRGAKVIY